MRSLSAFVVMLVSTTFFMLAADLPDAEGQMFRRFRDPCGRHHCFLNRNRCRQAVSCQPSCCQPHVVPAPVCPDPLCQCTIMQDGIFVVVQTDCQSGDCYCPVPEVVPPDATITECCFKIPEGVNDLAGIIGPDDLAMQIDWKSDNERRVALEAPTNSQTRTINLRLFSDRAARWDIIAHYDSTGEFVEESEIIQERADENATADNAIRPAQIRFRHVQGQEVYTFNNVHPTQTIKKGFWTLKVTLK